jgi:hypothetical protein
MEIKINNAGKVHTVPFTYCYINNTRIAVAAVQKVVILEMIAVVLVFVILLLGGRQRTNSTLKAMSSLPLALHY